MPVVAIAEIGNFLIFGSAIGGGIGGCFEDGECKRDVLNTAAVPRMNIIPRQAAVGACNVPKYNFDQCNTELASVTIQTSSPASGEAQFDNVPAACMDLAGVLSGACEGASAAPVPCGSACLRYSGLTDADFSAISKALGTS